MKSLAEEGRIKKKSTNLFDFRQPHNNDKHFLKIYICIDMHVFNVHTYVGMFMENYCFEEKKKIVQKRFNSSMCSK